MDYETLVRQIKGKRCLLCRESPVRIAWINGDYIARCGCYPKPPVLEKTPRSELSKAIADPNYGTDAITRMSAERIIAKRGDK